jgi:hypothetical protein
MPVPTILSKLYEHEKDLSLLTLQLGALEGACPIEVTHAAMVAASAVTHLRQMVVASIEAGSLTLPIDVDGATSDAEPIQNPNVWIMGIVPNEGIPARMSPPTPDRMDGICTIRWFFDRVGCQGRVPFKSMIYRGRYEVDIEHITPS